MVQMDFIHVYGGISLQGKVRIQGSKNAALPILAATVLTREENVIRNCPKIADVYHMLTLLKSLGCRISREKEGVCIDASMAGMHSMPAEAITGMRSSLCLLGVLIGRTGEVTMEYPGGCVIGTRPIDLHLKALSAMGVKFTEEGGKIKGTTPDGLHGTEITMERSSVGATQNIILAAVTAQGDTVIHGAAKEPEVQELCRYLQKCGADIEGIGTSQLVIKGGRRLYGTEYAIPADRIVAGTYLFTCMSTGGNVLLEEAPIQQMQAELELAGQMGAECQVTKEGLYVQAPEKPKAVKKVETLPYPGFPTDLQSVVLTAATQADGECLIQENIFENRFRTVPYLQSMGADITCLNANRVLVRGKTPLCGKAAQVLELRGGAALTAAGLAAKGETILYGCEYIARGYENICRDLRELGARIYSL